MNLVSLNWAASTSQNVTGYNIYRGTINGGPYTFAANPGLQTQYMDYNIQNGQTYYYVTTAVNNGGQESGYSNQAMAAVPAGISQTATVSLTASAMSLSSLVCSPSSLNSGAATTCTVSLTNVAPAGGVAVPIATNNSFLPVPAPSVTVPAGASTVTFTAKAGTISSSQSATLTATLSGVSKTATISLLGPLAVSAVSPNSGPATGGTPVTITGANFVSGATVTFGGTAASNVTVVNSTTITTTTPTHAVGAVTVSVSAGGQSANRANGFTYTASSTPISFVQVAATTTPSAQTVTVAYPGAQTAGDLNIVVVGWNDISATVQSVRDSAGNTYSLAIGPTSGTNLQQSIYYASNIRSGNNTVTVTFNQAAIYPDVRVLEYRGVSKVDATAGASGNSAVASSGSANTTSSNELIFSSNTVYTWVSAAGSGFTPRVITPYGDVVQDEVATSAGSYSASATLGSPGPWVMQTVTFSAGSPTSPTVRSVSPNSGTATGGTPVIINGTNFASGGTVTFGGIAATKMTVINSTTITATTPAHAAGAVTVSVSVGGQSASLANGFTYTASSTPISFVQVAATTTPATQTVTVAYPGAQTAGDLNIVVVGWNDISATVQSVKDSAGNTYHLAIGPTSSISERQSIYYASNIVSGNNTVTVTFNQAANYPDVRVLEYRGVSKLDVTAGAGGNSAASSGSTTATSSNELVFAANTVNTWVSAAGSGFTPRVITPYGDVVQDEVVTSAGSYSSSATLGSPGPWVMQIVAFK
ncbi:MAG TPA: IPT/TIG domain-containing protein [Bryobacteraceae bacterium]